MFLLKNVTVVPVDTKYNFPTCAIVQTDKKCWELENAIKSLALEDVGEVELVDEYPSPLEIRSDS